MAGTINLSLTQQFDKYGKPLNGGKLYIVQAGTTATPQNAYQDSALTIALPNPIPLDAAGRIPPFFLADGQIKVRLTDTNNVTQLEYDNLLVVGPSSGGGGGGSVDPTTIIKTGYPIWMMQTGAMTGFVRMNGRTIGSATSGATERANADTASLYDFLWQNLQDFVCPVTGGRGASSGADFTANKPIGLPDLRGRTAAGLLDMGNSTSSIIGSGQVAAGSLILPGSYGGADSRAVVQANLPAISLAVTSTGTANVTSAAGNYISGSPVSIVVGGSDRAYVAIAIGTNGVGPVNSSGSISTSGTTAAMGSGTALSTIDPFVLGTWYQKL